MIRIINSIYIIDAALVCIIDHLLLKLALVTEVHPRIQIRREQLMRVAETTGATTSSTIDTMVSHLSSSRKRSLVESSNSSITHKHGSICDEDLQMVEECACAAGTTNTGKPSLEKTEIEDFLGSEGKSDSKVYAGIKGINGGSENSELLITKKGKVDKAKSFWAKGTGTVLLEI